MKSSSVFCLAGDKYKDNIPLLTPYDMGPFHLCDRIVYAPLTRCRAIGTVPQPAAIEYYTQRARKGGFILSEGTSPSRNGYGCAANLAATDVMCREHQSPSPGLCSVAPQNLSPTW